MVFDELTLESFIWENTTRAADARAESAVSARGASSREGCEASGTLEVSPPRRDADCGSQWRFLRLRACAPPRILGGVDIWRINGL